MEYELSMNLRQGKAFAVNTNIWMLALGKYASSSMKLYAWGMSSEVQSLSLYGLTEVFFVILYLQFLVKQSKK